MDYLCVQTCLLAMAAFSAIINGGEGFSLFNWGKPEPVVDCRPFANAVLECLEFTAQNTPAVFSQMQSNIKQMTGVDLTDREEVRRVACLIAGAKDLHEVSKILSLPLPMVKSAWQQFLASHQSESVQQLEKKLNTNRLFLAIKNIAQRTGIEGDVSPTNMDIIPLLKNHLSKAELAAALLELQAEFGAGFPGLLTMQPDSKVVMKDVDAVVEAIMECTSTADFAALIKAPVQEVTQVQMGVMTAIMAPAAMFETQILSLKIIREMDKLGLTKLQ